jgi:hypothetical protein
MGSEKEWSGRPTEGPGPRLSAFAAHPFGGESRSENRPCA